MPEGKLLVVMLTGVTVFTGEVGTEGLDIVEETELVPELHPLANESDRINATGSARENLIICSILCAESSPRHVNLVMKLLLETLRRMPSGHCGKDRSCSGSTPTFLDCVGKHSFRSSIYPAASFILAPN